MWSLARQYSAFKRCHSDKHFSEFTYKMAAEINWHQLVQNYVTVTLCGNVTSAGWQVTLCDPVWHVMMWVPVAVWQPCELLYTCHLLLMYTWVNAIFLAPPPPLWHHPMQSVRTVQSRVSATGCCSCRIRWLIPADARSHCRRRLRRFSVSAAAHFSCDVFMMIRCRSVIPRRDPCLLCGCRSPTCNEKRYL